MKNLIWLAIWVIGLMAPVAAHATLVTWSFYETGITSCNIPGNCVLPPQPYIFMTLVLPGPTSAGTAIWDGVNPPAYTGDSFILNVPFTRSLTPAFMGNPGPFGPGCSDAFARSAICDFNISWSETAGDLTSVSITIDAVNDDIGGAAGPPHVFGLTGGPITSDLTLGGCGNTQCTIAGFWQSDLVVPEPMSAVLLLTGLLGTGLASRSRLRAE